MINPNAPSAGMSIRVYLAGLAMQAIISKLPLRGTDGSASDSLGLPPEKITAFKSVAKAVSVGSVAYADALIAELNSNPTEPTS